MGTYFIGVAGVGLRELLPEAVLFALQLLDLLLELLLPLGARVVGGRVLQVAAAIQQGLPQLFPQRFLGIVGAAVLALAFALAAAAPGGT